jgi:LPXTG-site transpeptidase (sortase) family protein
LDKVHLSTAIQWEKSPSHSEISSTDRFGPLPASTRPSSPQGLSGEDVLGDVSPGFLGGYHLYQVIEKPVTNAGAGWVPNIVFQYSTEEAIATGNDGAGVDISPDTDNKNNNKDVAVMRLQERAWIPEWISIPAIGVDAPIVVVELQEIEYLRETLLQWAAPNFHAVGWHGTSAPLGIPGNTVLNGHHNIYGEVFRHLDELQVGDLIFVTSGQKTFSYRVEETFLLPERFKPVEQRLSNAQWILPTFDERLTLISCWPYESNTHRVVVLAAPSNLKTDIVE